MARYPVWKQSVEQLYEEHFNTLYRMALRSLNDRSQARDVIQEAFVKLLGSDRSFKTGEDAARYLFRSFRNLLIDKMRHTMRWKYQDVEDLHPERMSTAPRQEDDLVASRLEGRHVPLDQPDRGIFELAYFEKLTDEEIAEKLGLKITTVRYCLKKARKAIRELLTATSTISEKELDSFFSRAKT
jgi:RNA polymerase sigma-70 factor (ECF subfamily)